MAQFIVNGGQKLQGVVKPSGSKNAVLPILAATILSKGECVIKNVPAISDVKAMLKILEIMGAQTSFVDNVVKVSTLKLNNKSITKDLVSKMRASILLLGPILARFGEASIAFPGGCVLGNRSTDAHTEAFKQLGVKVKEDEFTINLKSKKIESALVVMPEMSVTATENIIMTSVLAKGKVEIHMAAMEPHIVDLCNFLNTIGAKISGIGTTNIIIEGVEQLSGGEYHVRSDYLEVGTFALASVLTRGEVLIEDACVEDLEIFLYKLWKSGAKFDIDGKNIKFYPSKEFISPGVIKTGVHPGFPTDLQAPFAVLLTQCQGESMIFETLFEGRLNYLAELEQMHAKIEILNPHQANIVGPRKLRGLPIMSHDIRAGAAMVLAALIAEGQTTINNINYIDRGYDKLDEKLRSLGADIQRV